MVSVELLSSHGQQLTDNQVAFSFYDDVFASSMFPSEGYGTGGTVIEITFTDNAPKDASCYFGSVFPVHGRPSRATMACVSPTMTPPRGVIPVGAAYLHSVALSDPLVYDVIPTPKLETLFPAATSSLGGTTITIVASPFMDTARAFCRFGDQVTVATKAEMAYLGLGVEADFFEFSVANATAWSNQAFDVLHARPIMPVIFTCETPRNSPGFVSVEVGMKSADGSEFDMAPTGHLVDFAFEAIPSVAYATPSFGISAGGSLVRIVGSHFSDAGRACGFGSASPTLSTFVSSALMVCESPAHEEGTIKIELALDDAWETWTTDSAQFQFMERASVFAIDPPNTVETGGNVVNLHGTGFASDAIDSCAFGTVGPTPSRVVSSRLLECVSPASEPQRALRVAGSGRNSQFSTDTFASVHVANTPKIEFAYPTRGPSTGGTRVAVVGSGLASLRTHEFVGSCAFGEKTSPADWLNIDELRSPEEVSVARAHALDHVNSTDTWRTLGVAMGWSMVICESTPSSPGFVPLGFRTDIGADVAEISFTFTPSALVSIVHPGIITDDPAWVIHAEGFDFPIDEGPAETGYVSCTFGSVDSATAAIFVSSAYIKCEAPSHMLPGLTQLNLVTDQGLRWTQDSSSVLDVLPSVRAIAVEPPTGWAEGGVSLEVHVGSLPVIVAENSLFPPFACQFGTIAPVASRATSTSMMCTTPAAVPGWRRVSVTPGINLMTGGDGPAPTFHVLPIPEVIAAAPLFGPTAGGNRVTFTGLGTLTLGNVACMFDGEVKEARAISATDVECTVPAHEPGVIQVSIVHSAFADGIGPHGLAVALGSPLTVFDSGTVDFEYFGIFHMVHHYPRRSPTMGGTMLNLYGDGFTRRDHSYRCMFGSGYFQDAEVVSSSIIRCAAPPRRLSGEALLTMTLDVHDSQIVGGEEEGRTGMHSFYWQPKLYSFDPDEAKSNGGQEIVLRGDDFIDVDTLSCRFGTVQVAAAFYSEDRIMCKAPARSPSFSGVLANKGQNTLEISANAFDYTTTGLVINYLPSADDANSGRQISALEALGLIYGYTLITEVLVTNGPVTGGTPAVIDGANFDSQDVSCKFMSTQTSAIWVNSFRIICMTPPQPAGFAALELLDGSETTNFGNQFHFHPRVKVSLLEPTFASTRGGELVMVNGKHFMQFAELGEMPYKVGTFCSLGTLAVEPAHFISSALVICETLEHQKADLALEISLNTMDKSFSRIQLHLRDHPSIDAIEPYGAPAVGGAVITVSGGPFDRDVPYGCKIGTLGHVAGFLLSPSQTACVLPSHVPGFVPLYVTQNWHDVSEAAVTFQYREPAVVDAVMPAHGLTQGGDLITVTGAHFKQGEQPYCRMGHQLVATDAVTPNAIVCYTPAMPPGFIRIGVADGFEDGIPDNMDQGKGAWFLFQPPAVTMAANPFVGGPGGGSLVTVTGYELVAFEPEGMLCHFGGDEPTNAYLISSVLARCESSAHAEGVVALELSATGPIQGLEYASFEYVNSPRPVALDPPAGPSEGGARLVLTLVGAEHWTVGSGTQGASVQFGTVWPLSIRSLGGGGVELFAPARTPSVAPLLITTDLSSSSPAFNGLKYNSYGLDSEVRVLATYPERSISSGGSLVDVTVAKRGEADEHVPRFCHFGLDSTPAHFVNSWEVCLSGGNAYLPALNTTLSGSFYEGPIDTLTSSSEVNVTSQFAKWASSPSAPTTSEPSAWFAELGRGGQCLGFTTVRCIAPAQAAGWTQVTVGDPHTPPSGTGGVPFEYLAAPVLFLSQPADGGMGGGSVARITGSHLHGADACWSGTDVVDAHVVSSSLVYCETPGARMPGQVMFGFGADAPPTGDAVLAFTYKEDFVPLSVTPTGGSNAGGVLLTITSHPDSVHTRASNPSCHIGTIGIMARASAMGYECVTPAAAGFTASVALSLNGADRTPESNDLAFAQRPDPATLSVSVTSLVSSGGAELFIEASIPGGAYDDLSCVFNGDYSAPATVTDVEEVCVGGSNWNATAGQSANKCLGSAIVRCIAPPLPSGAVSLWLAAVPSDSFTGHSHSPLPGAEIFVIPSPHVAVVEPAYASTSGGDVIHFKGAHMQVDYIDVVVGSSPESTLVRVVSSAVASIESPAHFEGAAVVVPRVDGQLAETSGDMPQLEYVAPSHVVGATPTDGSESGGALLVASLDGFSSGHGNLACSFGSVRVAARRASDGSVVGLECASPARASGYVQLRAEANGVGATSETAFAYRRDIHAYSVDPATMPSSGGSVTIVETFGEMARTEQTSCRFGTEVVPARVLATSRICTGVARTVPGYNTTLYRDPDAVWSALSRCQGWSTVACDAPSSPPGFVSLSVGLGGGEYLSSGLYVQYRSVPIVRRIQPVSGPASGVGVVKVVGADFVEDEGLYRFDDISPGVLDRVSSALVKCEVPDHDIGIVAFELGLGDDGQQYTRSGILYEYVQEPWVVGIEPPQGPLEGGATVKLALHVDHSLSDPSVDAPCRFGTIGPVRGQRYALGTSCVQPAHAGGQVPVATSLNEGEVWTESEVLFTYGVATAVVHAVLPTTGPQRGGTEVVVYAGGLRADRGVQCRFGMDIVTGQFVGGPDACTGVDGGADNSTLCIGWRMLWQEIRCVAPSYYPGVTTVEVTDIIGIFSDSKHEFEYQVPAEVVAVHPPVGSTEGSTVVTVQGVNLVGANSAKTICGFGDAEFTTAVEVSSVVIICESPAHPEGSVAVEVSVSDQGQQFSSSNALFDYASPVALRAAYPEGGPEEGGTVVSVQTDSVEGSLRTFGCRFGTIAPVSARKANDNIMQCMSPARDIGATQLEVTHNGGAEYSSSWTSFSYWPQSEILSIDPASGPIAGGTLVTVVGHGLRDTTRCRFGNEVVDGQHFAGVDTVYTVDRMTRQVLTNGTEVTQWASRTQRYGVAYLVCQTPSLAAGHVSVQISDAFGGFSASREVDFQFRAPAEVHALWPRLGSTEGGAVLSVTGFDLIGADRICAFGDTESITVVEVSSRLVLCEVPAHPEGTIEVEVSVVSEERQQLTSNGVAFDYATPISVRGIDPAGGPEEGGTVVSVQTDSVEGSLRTFGCRFGTIAPVSARKANDNIMQCMSPARDIGATQLEVTHNGGAEYSSSAFAFFHWSTANVLSVEPASGPISGGTLVTITGHGIREDVQCRFGNEVVYGNRVGGDWELGSDGQRQSGQIEGHQRWMVDAHPMVTTSVICRTPPLSAGHTSVEITHGHGGRSLRSVEFHYEVHPDIHAIAPSITPVDGGSIISILGEHLIGDGQLCGFGGAYPVTAHTISSAVIFCETQPHPPGAVSVEVSVSDDGQQFTVSGAVLEYSYSPPLRGITPASGAVEGGVAVMLVTGDADGIASNIIACSFGTTAPVLARVSVGAVECVSPAREAGAVQLDASVNLVDYTGSEVLFRYGHRSAVVDVWPEHGLATGGTEIVALVESVSEDSEPVCTFGAIAVQATVIDDFEICGTALVSGTTARLPEIAGVVSDEAASASSPSRYETERKCVGYVTVACLSPPQPAGFVSFDIHAGAVGGASSFSFDVGPEIFGISPNSGLSTGGTVVSVLGRHMLDARASLCRFGSDAPVGATFVSSALIRCETGAAYDTIAEVSVGSEDSLQFMPSTTIFEFERAPRLLSISQVEGVQAGGATVAITVDSVPHPRALACRIGTIGPVSAKSAGEQTVECVSPAHKPELVPIDLSLNLVDFTFDQLEFEFTRDVDVLAVHPASGFASGGSLVTISGRGFREGVECRFGSTSVPAVFLENFDGITEHCFGRAESVDMPTGNVVIPRHVNAVEQCVGWSMIGCEAPASSVGWTALEVRSSEGELASVLGFEFRADFQIYSATPSLGPIFGGTVVHLTARHVVDHDGVMCAFGNGPPSSAAFVSSALVRCESLDHEEGIVGVAVSADDFGRIGSSAAFEYAAAPRVVSLGRRTSGSQEGGTLLSVSMMNGESALELSCRVGTLAPVAATRVSSSQIACAMPAHRPGLVPVEISPNLADFTADSIAFEYEYSARVMSIVPAASPISGGVEVTARGVGFAADVECVFGEISVPATFVASVDGVVERCHERTEPQMTIWEGTSTGIPSGLVPSEECMGWSAVKCITPPAVASGIVSFAIRAAGESDLSSSGQFDFAFELVPEVMLVDPPHGSVAGGTVLSLIGRHMTDHNDPLCRFGSSSLAEVQFVSSALVRCEAAASYSEGEDLIEYLSSADAAFTDSVGSVAFGYVSDPHIAGLSPDVGLEIGGTPIRVSGANFLPGDVARVGTIGPIAARYIGSDALEIFVPAHDTESGYKVPVEVTHNAQGGNIWSSDEIALTYTFPVRLDGADMDVSTTAGGSLVNIYGSGLRRVGEAAARWQCRFDDQQVEAHEVSGSTRDSYRIPPEMCATGRCMGWSALSCVVPPGQPGFATLGIGMQGEEMSRDWFTFSFDVPASLVLGFPSESPSEGSGLVFVVGRHMRPGDQSAAPLCRFGREPREGAPAKVISSMLMICEAPEHPEGFAELSASLSDGGKTYSALTGSAGVMHYFAQPVRVTGSNPMAGPESGGTAIALNGIGFEDGPLLACRFGTTFPVAARFITAEQIECSSPARDAGSTVPLGATGNGRDYTPGGGLFGSSAMLSFQANLRVSAVTPRSGVTGGRTPVFITGFGFVNSTSLACRFGKEVVQSLYITPFAVLCIAPEQPTSSGTVFLEVSNNGRDWTSQRTLFHFAPCPAGYYCPDGEPMPCPRGAFCTGGSGAATNFTLCPAGTFQPRTTQMSCLPSPIGFISPDIGTSTPSPCPRGAVCDVTGLSSAGKVCPPGHFCLSGTRTANFTDFGTPERPLPCPFGMYCGPGVTTNRTIANNFTTPQTCFAGFMCEPGSVSPQGSGPCPSGHYCPPGQLIPCPSRTYCPGVANTEPKPCVPGLYQQEYGQSTCKKCPLGTICPGFARELPELCPPGFVCDEVGLPIPSKRCPAGHFCLQNTLTPDPLSALDIDQLLRSSPVSLDVTSFRPLPCLPATYCMEGVMSNLTLEGVFTQPQPCKEGSFCEWATSDKTFAEEGDVANPMLRCPPGNYCPKGTYIPIPAPRGYFAPGEGNAQAAQCLPGSYTHYEGFEVCLSCPAGYECAQDGTFKPTICRSGAVRSLRDSITCKNCPMGTWNPFRGLTDEALCIPCNPGLVCSAEGTENNKPFGDNIAQVVNEFIGPCEAELDTCVSVELQPLGRANLCPEGYVCDARTTVAAVKCPDGYFCGYGTSPETQFVNKCPAGYFCPEGTAASGRYQFPCSACHFCPEGTGVILPRCPEGTRSDPNADDIDDCIADRITFWRIQPLKTTLIDEAYAMLLLAYNESQADRRRSLLEIAPAPSPAGANDRNAYGDEFGAPRINKYSQKISPAALEKLGEHVSRIREESSPFTWEWNRRRLLQDTGEVTPDNSTNLNTDDGTNATDGEGTGTFDTSYFGECMGLNFDLLKPEFVMDDEGMPATDIEGTPMVKFTVPRNHIAKVKLDFRFIDDFIRHGQQYEVAIFVDDRVNDMMCNEEDFEKVPCPPWDTGDGVNLKTMGVIEGREFEEKCPKSTEALELPYWFGGNGVFGDNNYNVANPKMGTYVWKRGLHEINIGGQDETTFRFEVRMLHGLYQNATRRGFLDSMCIDTVYPERGNKKELSSFHILLENSDDLQVPLNVPGREPYQRSIELDYFLCSEAQMDPSCRYVYPKVTLDYNSTLASEWKQYIKTQELAAMAGMEILLDEDADQEMTDDVIIEENGDMHVPDILEKEQFIFTEDYWTQGRPLLAIDYLPFFSGCRGFDSHIYFWYLTETEFTEIEDFVNYGKCELVPVNETIFIDQWAPQVAMAKADSCEIEITCFYEEAFAEAAASTRWFEVEGETLFYITQEASERERLFEASVLANDQTTPEVNFGAFVTAIATDLAIPVNFGPAEGVEVTRGIVPTDISLSLSYFQTSPTDKRMVVAEGEFGDYTNAKKHDGSYTLTISTTPLGWFELLNAFAFDEVFYIALFHALGLLSVGIVVGFWLIIRLFTTLKDPPRFKFMPYLGIVTQAPSTGIFLAMIPFLLAQVGVRWIMENITLLTQFPISIDDMGREIDTAVVEKATAGRLALCFLTVSGYMISSASEILVPSIPEMDALREDNEESVMQPESWKRSHFILATIMVNITNLALMEFSYTDTYGVYFFLIFILMKAFHLIIEMQAEGFLGEVMLLTPISVGLSLTAGLVTIAADDFTDFTLGYYLELIIGLLEFVYLDAFIAYISRMVPLLKRKISLRLRLRRRTIQQQLLEGNVQREDSVVEDLMGFLTAYGASTAGLYMTPVFIYFYWDFNDYLQLSFLFGFRKNDLIIYLLFGLVIIPFQIIMDIFIFNIQELFHGWKVYEYMKYARYRYKHRTARWKGLEKTYDESIDYSLRTVDQLCFSSQFYFVLGIGGSGSFLFVLSLSMMLRVNYNMFEDILFGLVVALILGLCMVTRRVALFIADIVGLWKIDSKMDDDMINEDDLPTDFQLFGDKLDTERDTEASERGEFTLADLTTDSFRRKFLEHNRMWLLDQFAELLTPRTAKKFRKMGGKIRGTGGISDSDSDEGERDRFEGDVILADTSAHVMRMWLHEASKRTGGGRMARRLGLSETSDSDMERGPKWPPAKLSPEAQALAKGWLAAVKAVRAARGDRPVGELSSSDTDTDGGGLRSQWGMPVVSPASAALLRDWLQHAKKKVGEAPKGGGLTSSSDSGSSDGDLDRPVSIRPASALAMRQWITAVRARSRGPSNDQLVTRMRSELSSSSGESDTETGGFDGPARISATSQSLIRWWLVNLRRRMAEEGERMIAESIEQARSQLPQAPTGDDGFPDDDEFTDSSDDNFPVAQMSTDPTYTTSDPNAGRGGSSDDSNLDSSD